MTDQSHPMPQGDTNPTQPRPRSEAAKVLREAAERYWRFAEMSSEPDKFKAMAMRYHERAVRLEHGVWEI